MGDPLATATAVAALARMEEAGDPALRRMLRPGVVERGLAALSEQQRPDGSWWHDHDRTEADVAVTTAFVLYLLTDLGSNASTRDRVEMGKAAGWLAERMSALEGRSLELAQMALIDVPPLVAASRQDALPGLAA